MATRRTSEAPTPDLGPPPGLPSWLALARRTVLFIIGVIVILDAVFQEGDHLAELVAGLILLGFVSVDEVASGVVQHLKRGARNGHVSQGTPDPGTTYVGRGR